MIKMSDWDDWFKRLKERKGFFFPEIDGSSSRSINRNGVLETVLKKRKQGGTGTRITIE